VGASTQIEPDAGIVRELAGGRRSGAATFSVAGTTYSRLLYDDLPESPDCRLLRSSRLVG